ncbi:MAG: flavoprotein [Thermoplasmataceae archaeon]
MTNNLNPDCEKPLLGIDIIFCTGASISIYRVPDIMRDFIDAGASIIPVMSKNSESLITKTTIQWASGKEVIDELTGRMEHITLLDKNPEVKVLLICPASYDQIGKFASGIADGVVEALFAYALGHKIRIVIVPAMHLDMYQNPIMAQNLERLSGLGIMILKPNIADGKAKIQSSEEIMDAIIRSGVKENGKRILIVSGRSEVSIDPVRAITNRSSGITGKWLARWAYRSGFDKITLIGNCTEAFPSYVDVLKCTVNSEFYRITIEELKKGTYDGIIIAAALSDYEYKQNESKIDSSCDLLLHLKPLKKLKQMIKEQFKTPMISFKLTHRDSDLSPGSDEIIIVNYIEDNVIGAESGTYSFIVNGKAGKEKTMCKSEMAQHTINLLERMIDQ